MKQAGESHLDAKDKPDVALRKLTNLQLADRIRSLVAIAGGTGAALLHEAARRLAAQTEQGYRVASVRQLSLQSPTLFEGTLEDGDEFMVRYKNHRLTVYIDDQLVEYEELPETLPPNRITLEEIEKCLNGLLVFPSERIASD